MADKTATYIKPIASMKDAALYKLTPAADDERDNPQEYVVVSALTAAFDTGRPETYVFPADADGTITDWLEMPGSRRGIADRDALLAEMGYEVVRSAEAA